MSFISTVNKRREAGEEGFTLLELVIVVAVLGILVAIGIPATAWIQSWSKSVAYEANSNQLLRSFEARFIQEGGTYLSYDLAVGDEGQGTAFGNQYALAQQVANEVLLEARASMTGDDWGVGFFPDTPISETGIQTLNPCFYTVKEDLGRTVCRDGGSASGPQFGLEDYM